MHTKQFFFFSFFLTVNHNHQHKFKKQKIQKKKYSDCNKPAEISKCLTKTFFNRPFHSYSKFTASSMGVFNIAEEVVAADTFIFFEGTPLTSSSFLTKRPLIRTRLSAKFLRTSYLIFLLQTLCLRFSIYLYGRNVYDT